MWNANETDSICAHGNRVHLDCGRLLGHLRRTASRALDLAQSESDGRRNDSEIRCSPTDEETGVGHPEGLPTASPSFLEVC